MSYRENDPAIFTDNYSPAELKPMRIDGGAQAQAAYHGLLMRSFLTDLVMPRPDRMTLIRQASGKGIVIEDWWPGMVAVPLAGLELTRTSTEALHELAQTQLYRIQGRLVSRCLDDLLFMGQLTTEVFVEA